MSKTRDLLLSVNTKLVCHKTKANCYLKPLLYCIYFLSLIMSHLIFYDLPRTESMLIQYHKTITRKKKKKEVVVTVFTLPTINLIKTKINFQCLSFEYSQFKYLYLNIFF